MRRRYRWNDKTQRLEEIANSEQIHGHMIMPDIEPFISPIDGSVVSSRSRWREHDKRHGVTNASDFKEQWARQAKERQALLAGRSDKKARIAALVDAYDKVTRRRP